MDKSYGKKQWVFPDGDRPPAHREVDGADETLMILNTTNSTAHIQLTVYYTDQEPINAAVLEVPGQRIKCISTAKLWREGKLDVGIHEQYAFTLQSDAPIVAQYLKCSDDDQPMHVYGMMGYNCDFS